jgi:putative aminopeptidase FrvX
VRVGDPITLTDQFELLRNDLAISRAFDNRVGTFAVAEALRLASETKGKLKAEILAVSNIMEEVGLLGSRQIAYTLKPDVALVVDVTHATDYPTVSQQQHGDIKIGHGPAITHGVCNHPEVVARIENVARAQKIKLQHEAVLRHHRHGHRRDFLDARRHPSALISLPNRYMHSPVELVSLKDLEQIPRLHVRLRPLPQIRRSVQSQNFPAATESARRCGGPCA